MLADDVESGRCCPWDAVAEVGELVPLARCFEIRDTLWLGEPPRGSMALTVNKGRHRYIWSSGKVNWW